MKGGGVVVGGYPGKRRWRCLAVGVLFLVLLSMLVPLVFLLGLHNGFQSAAFISDQPSSVSPSRDPSSHVDEIIEIFGPKFPQVVRNNSNEVRNETVNAGVTSGIPVHAHPVKQSLPSRNLNRGGGMTEVPNNWRSSAEGSEKLCELRFGSYCHWREEHREDMKDSMVKKLKDQLFVARAYFPSIAKLPAQNKLSRELRQNIQDLERVLSESTTDADLPSQIEEKLRKTEAATARAKVLTADCNNVDKKLRQIYDLTEDEANFHMKQSAFLYQIAVQTMPKSLHCLSMRLTMEYFKYPSRDMDFSLSKYSDPNLHHYILFSNNALASSVVINSTVMHARESSNVIFHVLTDEQNYFAMKLWFLRNNYKDAAVQVLNLEQLDLDYHDKAAFLSMSLPAEFRVSFLNVDSALATHLRTEYISVFSHVHYLLPFIFPNLKKVVVLDDDVVVQRDLSALWSLNMGGKVNGALQLCSVRLGQLNNYLRENTYNRSACAWMSGLNVIDLTRWRELDLTETYRKLGQEVVKEEGSVEAIALRASLLTFQDLNYALDGAWILSGLGHDYQLDVQVIKNAAVLHYNGKMKPWLELGIPKYKHYWKRFLNREDQYLGECNVNP